MAGTFSGLPVLAHQEQALAKAGDAAVEECEFIADVRGSVPYKRELMRVYVRRAVSAALEGKDGVH